MTTKVKKEKPKAFRIIKPKKDGKSEVVIPLTRLEVRSIFRYLSVPMHGSDAAFRYAFLKTFRPVYEKVLDGRDEIVLSYAEKDENGKILIQEGQYKIPTEKQAEATKASVEYLLQDSGFTLSVKDAKKLAFVIDKNNRADMSIDEADIYYQVLGKLESK